MRVHLLDSAEPLKEGTDLTANCSSLVPKAAFAFMVDIQSLGPDSINFGANTLMLCADCIQGLANRGPSRRYCYGIIAGQESKQIPFVQLED